MPKPSNDQAWRRVERVIRKCDVVLQILDSRLPLRSSKLEQKLQKLDKKMIFVLNKCDLISRTELRDWQKKLGGFSIPFSAKRHYGMPRLKKAILSSSQKRPVKVGIVGYPNVGKSSIINAMVHRKAASTSPIAGHTRGEQWIKAANIMFFDSPGVIPSNQSEMRLAIANAIDPDQLKDPERVALRILKITNAAKKYKLEKKGVEALEELSLKHGKLHKGGVPDMEYSIKLLIREFQRGNIRRKKTNELRANP